MNSAAITVGRQTFDGLGRQRSVEVAGRTTQYHYRPGQLPPSANTLANGRRTEFAYEPQLNNALLRTTVEGGSTEQLIYHPQLAQPVEARGVLGTQRWRFSPTGRPIQDTWVIEDVEHSNRWQTSLDGKPLNMVDANATQHQRQYDGVGRLSKLTVGEVETAIEYDALSRTRQIITQHQHSGTLARHFTYDAMGREASCTFIRTESDGTQVFTQTLGYDAFDQLTQRTWSDGEQTAEERFAYDTRGRLVHYLADAAAAPRDPFGNAIVEQRFVFNALDGYQQVISTFSDGSADTASFSYAANDPCQVVAIEHSHPSWPARIELTYDAHGRVIADSLGRTLGWDAHERLHRVEYAGKTCEYRYTPDGQLRDRIIDGELNRSFFSGKQMTHECQGASTLEVIGDGSALFALNKVTEGVRQTTLLGCDSQGSVRIVAGDQTRRMAYSPHGAEQDNDQQQPFGFAGQRREPLTGWYIAAGYRPYDPLLMCFLAPDSESPFGKGGINAYAYCGGDPVNRIDPDGHSWQNWLVAGIGLAVGAIATVASLGTAGAAIAGGGLLSASAALSVTTAALNVISLGTGVAAMAVEAQGKNDKAASVLGWISLGAGVASILTGMASARVGLQSTARKGGAKLTRAGAVRQPESLASTPTRWQSRSEILYSSDGVQNDVAWHNNLWGKGISAFETHGSSGGQLMNAQGVMDDPVRIAIKEIAPRLAKAPADTPIVLLACEGGKSGAAQKVANVLQRPVYGYDKVIYVHRANRIQNLELGSHFSTVPQQKISAWQRLMGARSPFEFGNGKFEVASGRTYFPQ